MWLWLLLLYKKMTKALMCFGHEWEKRILVRTLYQKFVHQHQQQRPELYPESNLYLNPYPSADDLVEIRTSFHDDHTTSSSPIGALLSPSSITHNKQASFIGYSFVFAAFLAVFVIDQFEVPLIKQVLKSIVWHNSSTANIQSLWKNDGSVFCVKSPTSTSNSNVARQFACMLHGYWPPVSTSAAFDSQVWKLSLFTSPRFNLTSGSSSSQYGISGWTGYSQRPSINKFCS